MCFCLFLTKVHDQEVWSVREIALKNKAPHILGQATWPHNLINYLELDYINLWVSGKNRTSLCPFPYTD